MKERTLHSSFLASASTMHLRMMRRQTARVLLLVSTSLVSNLVEASCDNSTAFPPSSTSGKKGDAAKLTPDGQLGQKLRFTLNGGLKNDSPVTILSFSLGLWRKPELQDGSQVTVTLLSSWNSTFPLMEWTCAAGRLPVAPDGSVGWRPPMTVMTSTGQAPHLPVNTDLFLRIGKRLGLG